MEVEMKGLQVFWGMALLTATMHVAAGSCYYTQENMFAGPFEVCMTNTDAARCAEIGTEDSNANAKAADEDCKTEGSVGACDMGDNKLVYYSGEADGLETGCGFQGGDWVTAE